MSKFKHKEVEFKYQADHISLHRFKTICETDDPIKRIESKGRDLFYFNEFRPDAFFRVRYSDHGVELTFKEKEPNGDNYIRTEYNVSSNFGSIEHICALLVDLGYHYNTSIIKTSCAYDYGWYTLAHYTCYKADETAEPVGSFIEIEINENDPSFETTEEAFEALEKLEKKYWTLGVFEENRVSSSLFELYRT